MTDKPAFEYRDEDGDDLIVRPMRGVPAVMILTGTNGIAVDLDHVEEVVAGIRDAARQAGGQPGAECGCGKPETSGTVHRPGAPCYVDETPSAQPNPTAADDPTPLRWGLGDVLHSDDDTVIVCLSGPDREPYWLELDPDRATALRNDLTPPAAGAAPTNPATETQAHPPRVTWRVEGYDADEWNAISCTFHRSEDAHERKRHSHRYPDMPTRVVRETTTWTVEHTPHAAGAES